MGQIAAELADPNTNLGSINMFIDYIRYGGDVPGADEQSAFSMIVQPNMPYKLNESTNLFVRPFFPIIFSQDVLTESGFETKGIDLGDTLLGLGRLLLDAQVGDHLGGGFHRRQQEKNRVLPAHHHHQPTGEPELPPSVSQ